MVERSNSLIYREFNQTNLDYWFDFKQRKFLHNIDTFYYSVKLQDNFLKDSREPNVIVFREFWKRQDPGSVDYNQALDFGQEMQLNHIPLSFAGFYDICVQCPDYFDIFMASSVPSSSSGSDETVTSEIIVQIRSCLLWQLGVTKAFEYSYQAVDAILKYFDLTAIEVKENRADYCWHTNYLQNPELYFRVDNMKDMMVTNLGSSNKEEGHRVKYEYVIKRDRSYENDYFAAGKRSDKCFLRIYLKSKEVVQEGYKPWFLQTWLFHQLINRYDFYVYEECFKSGRWMELDVARLKFYLEYGRDDFYKSLIRDLINAKKVDMDAVHSLANQLTPSVHIIINVEYQTTRRLSKSFVLVKFKDNSGYGIKQRIYDYLDNRKMIAEYLTHSVFRLVDLDQDENRSRCDYVSFWKGLRSCKMVDVYLPPDQLKLHRDYSRELSREIVKKRVVNGIITAGLYQNGLNDFNPMQDVIDFVTRLNDNDMHNMMKYKKKKKQQLNATEISEIPIPVLDQSPFAVIDRATGEEINLNTFNMEEDSSHAAS